MKTLASYSAVFQIIRPAIYIGLILFMLALFVNPQYSENDNHFETALLVLKDSVLFIGWGAVMVVIYRGVRGYKHVGWQRVQILCLIGAIGYAAFSKSELLTSPSNLIILLVFVVPIFLAPIHLVFFLVPWIYDGFKLSARK